MASRPGALDDPWGARTCPLSAQQRTLGPCGAGSADVPQRSPLGELEDPHASAETALRIVTGSESTHRGAEESRPALLRNSSVAGKRDRAAVFPEVSVPCARGGRRGRRGPGGA